MANCGSMTTKRKWNWRGSSSIPANEARAWAGASAGLAGLARSRYPRVFLRVHPDNLAARRCYAAAGFQPVEPDQSAAWNASQPVDYVWLSLVT
jgi:RimJ/RimL family protein N-acetyltransferase